LNAALMLSASSADPALLRVGIFKLFLTIENVVMAGLDPAIHVFLADVPLRRGCPGQAQA
jgi:hypothetical protein